MVRNFKRAVTVLVILILAAATYAFAAANTIQSSNAGYKASDISGYAISSVTYDLGAADPTKLVGISFKVTAIDSSGNVPVVVKISTTGTIAVPAQNFTTSTCVVSGAVSPWQVICTFTAAGGIDLITVTALDIVVSSSIDSPTPAP